MDTPAMLPLRPPTLAILGACLRQQRESLHLTLDNLAHATGISKPYLSNIETARTPGPPSEPKLRLIAQALHLPPDQLAAAADWLRTPLSIRQAFAGTSTPRRSDGTINLDALITPPGAPSASLPPQAAAKPPRRSKSAPSPSAIPPEEVPLPLHRIPLINRVAAGSAAEFTDLDYPAGIADQYLPMPDLPEAPAATAFALRVLGDSMAPGYIEGELLIVGPGEPRDGDDCVVRLGELDNFATTFKRIFFEGHGDAALLRLLPLNPAHAERRVPLSQVTGIYPLLYRLVPAHHPRPAEIPPPVAVPAPISQSFTTPLSLEND